MSITVSAPGKIHLLGEHAVVYGKPALLAAVDKRVYVRIMNYELRIRNNGNLIINTAGNDSLIRIAVSIFQRAFKIEKLMPLEITVSSQIPSGCGLGSSAAVAAATAGALMKSVKNIWNPAKINELAYQAEKIAHGNPSGADNTAVVFGGLVWFRREFEFLKSIWSLPVASYKIPKFAILNSGIPAESTKEMVELVRTNYSKRKKYFNDLFENQEEQTKKLLLSLKEGNREKLKEAIIAGEDNLEKMGVVGKKAGEIIKFITKLGAAAKICGAGGVKNGSGAVLCYHDNLLKLKPVENKFNVKLENISLACEGIRIENI